MILSSSESVRGGAYYAARTSADRWKDMSIQIIGSRYATTPDYVRAVRAAVTP